MATPTPGGAIASVTGPVHLSPRLSELIGAAVTANANITILVIIGVAATFRGVFDQKGISDLGKLVYHISLPCLLLVSILKEVSIYRLGDLILLPAVCILEVTFAYLMTSLLNRMFRISDIEARPVLATVIFGNVGALSIAVMQALCREHPFTHILKDHHECAGKSTSFIAFYLVTQNILMFTWGERILIRQALESEQIQRDKGVAIARGTSEGSDTPNTLSASLLKDHLPLSAQGANGNAAWSISVPSLSAMHYNSGDEEGVDEARTLSGASSYHDLHELQNEDMAHELQLRLTTAALNEVSSRLPLEVKVWAPDSHGGAAAIRRAAQDESEDEDSLESPTRNDSQSISSGEAPASMLSRLCRRCDNCRRRLRTFFAVVKRWSCRRCFRGTRRRLINSRRSVFQLLKNPPLQAACIGLFIGIIPQLKGLFVGHQAPLRCAFKALETLGGSQVPVSMLMLSGSGTLRYLKKVEKAMDKSLGDLDVEAPSFSFSRRAIGIMICGRLVGVPLFGLACWWGIKRLGFMPVDPLIGFVLLIESAVPSAQNVVMLLLVHGELAQGAAMAEVILLQYVVAIPIFTVFCSIFAICIFPGTIEVYL